MSVDIGDRATSNSSSQEIRSNNHSAKNPTSTGATKEQTAVRKSEIVENRNIENNSDVSKSQSEVREQLKEWTSKMNVAITEKIHFSYSEDFGGIYVTVVDNETNEVIRKIPTEDAIKLSAIWKEAVGNIFDSKG